LKRLWQEEVGQDLVEYGLLLTLIALVAVASMKTIGSAIKNVFSAAAINISTAS
jgi:pilus assembly protein Flp/PilA